MRILWAVNVPFPDVCRHLSLPPVALGGWLQSLAKVLIESEIDLHILWATKMVKRSESFISNNITFHIIKLRETESYLTGQFVRDVHDVVRDYSIDLFDVFGTEQYYGLASEGLDIPCIVNIQGVINELLPVYWGTAEWIVRLKKACLKDYYRYRFRAKMEKKIFDRNSIYCGRTEWDKSIVLKYRNDATYYHRGEILREVFYKTNWDINLARPNSIFCVSKNVPYKGLDVLVRALAMVKKQISQVELFVAGNFENYGYSSYIFNLTKKLGLNDNVSFLGTLTDVELASMMQRSRVYVMPSHLENSSNSLAEAQLVGIPQVVAEVGGIPSLVDGDFKVCYKSDDHSELASQLLRMLQDENYSVRQSRSMKEVAQVRHSVEVIVSDVLRQYSEVVK
ncbi:glycosyltransferase [Desulfovibrio mangrovi]|uniref:glycosyltransferase family 4 protein n=1 Tax=Desulfovibrio mangrovi TaxID=2976983 RepID=UPI002246D96A|nr:glycosyltransferase [Desulfovibrio mangrovi]UZP67613.1 glycosyltransferase [Desulfovibrio mangrovi]